MIKTITKISRIEINVQHALLCAIMNTHQTRLHVSELMRWILNDFQRAPEGLVNTLSLLDLTDGYKSSMSSCLMWNMLLKNKDKNKIHPEPAHT